MSDYFANQDCMKMIQDQMSNNPGMEISNIKTVKFPLKRCFEHSNMNKLRWNCQELQNGDVLYWMDQHCTIFKVRIFVEKLTQEENFKLTVQQNLENAQAFMKAKKEASIGVCSGPDCSTLVDEDGYNAGALQ